MTFHLKMYTDSFPFLNRKLFRSHSLPVRNKFASTQTVWVIRVKKLHPWKQLEFRLVEISNHSNGLAICSQKTSIRANGFIICLLKSSICSNSLAICSQKTSNRSNGLAIRSVKTRNHLHDLFTRLQKTSNRWKTLRFNDGESLQWQP